MRLARFGSSLRSNCSRALLKRVWEGQRQQENHISNWSSMFWYLSFSLRHPQRTQETQQSWKRGDQCPPSHFWEQLTAPSISKSLLSLLSTPPPTRAWLYSEPCPSQPDVSSNANPGYFYSYLNYLLSLRKYSVAFALFGPLDLQEYWRRWK